MTSDAGAPPPRQDRTPRHIAHYAIRDRLGKGAMGVVYRAVDERTRQEVALKVMVGDLEGDQETRVRFFREAQIAGQLRHRNVVNVFESGEDGNRLYIAMELLNGCTLTDFLKEHPALDLESRIDLMIQVCQGLMVAHDAGIYHRDIKPANLFVCEDQRLKILDFGVARLANSNMTLTGYILGTPDFMSPEQARGGDIDERSDIFSSAAVFYLMITGRKPFAAADLPAVLNKVLRVDPVPIRDDEAPEAIALVIQKALSKDPMRRQQNVAQLIDDLMSAEAAIGRASRQAGLALRPAAEELVTLSSRRLELSTALELADRSDAWRAMVERHSVLQRGPMALGGFPLRRLLVATMGKEIESELAPLRDQVRSLETAQQAFADGRGLMKQNNFDQAAARLAAARHAVPNSPAITRELDACSRVIEQRREQDALLQGRLKAAADAALRQDWQTVLGLVAKIEDVSPGHAEVARLRQQASRALESDRERQQRERLQLQAAAVIEAARQAAQQGRLDDAINALEAHLSANPQAPGVGEAIAAMRREQQLARVRAERAALGELETTPGMLAAPTDETMGAPPAVQRADLKDRAAGFLRRFQKGQK